MKKRKFNARAMKEFAEPKVVHESKPVDLITQFNRMRSIAADIYNSDFYMIAAKAEQKKIEASIACISATMISMIGMEAIKNSHDRLPDDSGDNNDHSWDNLPDDSGDDTDTDSHDAKYPMQILDDDSSALGNEHDDDSDEDADDVNLGNFADGPFYSDQYRDICQLYRFNIEETLKRIVKTAYAYTVSKLNLVGVVNEKHDIKSDDKYYPNTGDVFFVTNKENDKDPVFVLIYAKSYLELFDFDIDKVSTEIKPVDLEESTKTNHIDSIGSEAYFNIGELHLDQNTIIDLNATWEKIKKKAEEKDIKTITFVDTIKKPSDIYSGKYSLKPGSLFFSKEGYPRFILIYESHTKFQYIDSVLIFKKDNSDSDKDDIEFIGIDDYYNIDKSCPNSDQVIDLDATLIKIKKKAKEEGIKTITFIDTIEGGNHASDKYSYESGALFFVKNTNWVRFELLTKTDFTMFYHIDPVLTWK